MSTDTGTSELEATRVCPWPSKYCRNASRISAVFIVPSHRGKVKKGRYPLIEISSQLTFGHRTPGKNV